MPRKKRTTQKSWSENPIFWILVVVGIILCCVGIWYLTRNPNLYAPDKEQIRRNAQSVLDDVNFEVNPTYSSLEDLGCDSGGSVGLEYRGRCNFLAQKYYRASGNFSGYLKEADKKLVQSGWQRDNQSNEYEEVFSGGHSKQLSYKREGKSLSLVFYRNAAENSSYDIRRLLEDGKIPPVNDGEFLYGVKADMSYWSCRWDSFFKQPCIAPSAESTRP